MRCCPYLASIAACICSYCSCVINLVLSICLYCSSSASCIICICWRRKFAHPCVPSFEPSSEVSRSLAANSAAFFSCSSRFLACCASKSASIFACSSSSPFCSLCKAFSSSSVISPSPAYCSTRAALRCLNISTMPSFDVFACSSKAFCSSCCACFSSLSESALRSAASFSACFSASLLPPLFLLVLPLFVLPLPPLLAPLPLLPPPGENADDEPPPPHDPAAPPPPISKREYIQLPASSKMSRMSPTKSTAMLLMLLNAEPNALTMPPVKALTDCQAPPIACDMPLLTCSGSRFLMPRKISATPRNALPMLFLTASKALLNDAIASMTTLMPCTIKLSGT